MNFYAFKNRFKYGYKKFFAILFAIFGLACEITAFVLDLVLRIYSLSILDIISYCFIIVAYYHILTGNIRGTTVAYRGFMVFVFYILFSFGLFLFQNVINSIPMFLSGQTASIVLAIVFLALSILAFISGLMTYIKFRSYQMLGRSTTYETVRNWCLVFTIITVLAWGTLIPFNLMLFVEEGLAITDVLVEYFLYFMEPTAIIFIAISAYFTILRLKD